MLERLKEIAKSEISDQWVDRLVEIALAVWTFSQIVFVHSDIGAVPFVVDHRIADLFQALVAGCLVAGLAARGIKMKTLGIISLFCALFVTLAVWRNLGNEHFVVLLLFVLLAKDMDIFRLVRIYTLSALLALLVVSSCVLTRLVNNYIIVSGTSAELGYGFRDLSVLPCILLSVLVSIVIGSRERVPWWHFLVVCAVVAIVCFAVLHSFITSLVIVAYCAAVTGRKLDPRIYRAMNSSMFKLLVAVFPLVLFLMVLDGAKLLGFPVIRGGYYSLGGSFGYSVLAVVYVLYARSVLLMKESNWKTTLPFALMLFSVVLASTKVALYLECNCTLLFLMYGVSGSKQIISCVENGGEVRQ